MKQPSPKALSAWCSAQPRGEYTCADCGKRGPEWKVQPQHPYYADGKDGVARCVDCISAINLRMAAERKATLAALPRCEVDNCRARGNWTVAGGVLMCGRHLKAAQREHNRRMSAMGGMGLFMGASYQRSDILNMAKGGKS